ncbi:MAG TPA: hypothetical protein VNA57_00920 [Acidimicrobiales bacterium]|nr:hypothetical protein [Acidimicrobiales bacterium]
MARIIDTSPAFETYARTAFLESAALREQQWQERYEAAHPDVFEAFYAKEPATDGRKALVRELSALRQRVGTAAPAMVEILEEVDPQVQEALGVESPSSPVHVLLVGPSSTNAAVGRLGDEVALFHCLEWFRTADGARVLAAHEDAHAWHEIGLAEEPPADDVAWMAFSEGLAISASRAVVPGRPDDDYFWFGYDGFEDWLAWCQEHREELLARFAEALDDPTAFDTYFGAGLVDGRWRTGYFVADEVVRSLGRSLPEMAAMTVSEGREAVREVLGTAG